MRTDIQKVVILGGGYAGMLAAVRLAQKGLPLDITLVDSSDRFVERIRLHQVAAGQAIPRRPMTDLLPKTVKFRQGRVVGLSPVERRVSLETATGLDVLGFDWLIYALGSGIDVTSVPGVQDYAYRLSGYEAAQRLHTALKSQAEKGGRVLVVGGGLTGIESATEIAESFPTLSVELLTAGMLGNDLAPAGQGHLRRTLDRLGIGLREQARVTQLTADGAYLADGSTVPFDVCLWTSGFAVSPLAAEAGLPVNGRGRLLTDAFLRVVGHAHIFAVGDAAETFGGRAEALRMACATAMPMGAYAADALAALVAGQTPAPFRFGYVIRCISLGRRDGLVQMVDANDRPTPRIVSGRAGALVKEMICRYTVMGVQGERALRLPLYAWPQPKASPSEWSAVTDGSVAG